MKYQKGFSLIELIGVLAIIAIVLSAATPSIINQIKNATYDQEVETLSDIAESLTTYITDNHIIPSNEVWAVSLSNYTTLSATDLLATKSGTRRYIVHPSFTIDNFPADSYNQDSLFLANNTLTTTKPTNTQILLISNVVEDLPATTLNQAQFDAVWSQSGTIPAGFSLSDSVVIQRISLGGIFQPFVMNILSPPATWAVNSTATADERPWPSSVTTQYIMKNSTVYTRATVSGTIDGAYLTNQGYTL